MAGWKSDSERGAEEYEAEKQMCTFSSKEVKEIFISGPRMSSDVLFNSGYESLKISLKRVSVAF